MDIPFEQLSPEVLKAVVESFILREGTDYGKNEISLEAKVEQVTLALKKREAKLVFDLESESVSIVPSHSR